MRIKAAAIAAAVMILAGCDGKNIPPEEWSKPPEPTEVQPTTYELIDPEPVYTQLTDDIRVYDLSMPGNADVRKPDEAPVHRFGMPDYGEVCGDDTGILLEKDGEVTVLIPASDYDGNVRFCAEAAIDDHRFVYTVTSRETVIECGVYDLSAGERITVNGYIPRYIAGNRLVLLRGDMLSGENFGYSLMELDTYRITDFEPETDSQFINGRIPCAAFSGTMAATLSEPDYGGRYTLSLCTLNGRLLREHTIEPAAEFATLELRFTDDKLELYAAEPTKERWLYVIDVTEPVCEEIAEGITCYDLTLPENESLYKDGRTFAEFEMSGGTVACGDEGVVLKKNDGTTEMLIGDPGEAYHWFEPEYPIDENSFVYTEHGEWGAFGTGIFDLSDGSDTRLTAPEGYSYVPGGISGNELLLIKRKRGHYDCTAAAFCDLSTYQIREVTLAADPDVMYQRSLIIPGTREAVMLSIERGKSFALSFFSADTGEALHTYTIGTDKSYSGWELSSVGSALYLLCTNTDGIRYLYVIG